MEIIYGLLMAMAVILTVGAGFCGVIVMAHFTLKWLDK